MNTGMFTSKEQGYQTPPEYLEAVREVFGGRIGYDPATTIGNPTDAAFHSTPISSPCGLEARWNPRLPTFVNPPFKGLRGEISVEKNRGWGKKMAQFVGEAIYLVPARTDTEWWHDLADTSKLVCLHKGRMRFVDPATGERMGSAPFPISTFYRGPNWERFLDVFGKRGRIVWL